jgi:ankyrin repeat protein
MGKGMRARQRTISIALAALLTAGLAASPAPAQFSDSYQFMKAVRDRDGSKVQDYLDKPGTTIVNTRDSSSGESALHIVVQRRDSQWLGFLLSRGADPNLRDSNGNTALALAARLGWTDGVTALLARHANVNAANDRGETPLILAVQRRDLATVRLLLASGADPKAADHIAGMSAQDYAARDSRSQAILKAIEEAKPVKPAAEIAGPRL